MNPGRMNPLVLLVASAFFMEFLDGTIIVTALPAMSTSFRTTAVSLQVGITAYLLTVAVFILPGGWAAQRFGARTVFTAAIATFTAGSVLCGLAGSTPGFVAARMLQGLGGAMMVPVGRLVVLRSTPKPELMGAIALLTWPGLSAPLLGPPLGGFIAQHLTWRLIFLINLPLGVAGVGLALWLVPRLAPMERRRFDWRGFTYSAVLLSCTVQELDLIADGTASWLVIAVLTAGAGASGLLLWHRVQSCEEPLFNPAPLRMPTFRYVIVMGTVMRVLISAVPFLLPLMFQLGFGLDPFAAGLLVIALFAGNLGVKPVTTPVLKRFGFRTVLAANAFVQASTMLGCAMLTTAAPVIIAILLIVSGASRSLQFTALGTLAFADVPAPLMSSANTVFSVAFQLALGLGVAVGAVMLRAAGTMLHNEAASSLPAFRGAFGALAVLMALTALSALRLTRDAGAEVSGHTGTTNPLEPVRK
jgi:predicted MFS family arabinose efflux permease